jgi:hypothetical protein
MFAELLDAVQRRVNRYLDTHDVEDLLDPAGLRDATALLAVLPGPVPQRRFGFRWLNPEREVTVAAVQAAGLLRYARSLNMPPGPERDAERTAATDLLKAAVTAVTELQDQVWHLEQLAGTPPNDRAPATPIAAIRVGASPLGRIDDPIASSRRWLAANPSHEDAVPYRMNLGELQQRRFHRTGDVADLDAALATTRDGLAQTPADHPKRPSRLTTLGGQLQMRFVATGERSDLDANIDAMQQACDAAGPDHEDRSMHLSNLGRAHTVAYQVAGDPADLARAVDTLREAVSVMAPGEAPSSRGTRMGALHTALALRYDRTGDPADLDEAFRLAREAEEVTPPGDHNTIDRVLDLASAHALRHRRSGDPADAAEATRPADEVRRVTADGDPDQEQAERILALVRSAPA